MARWQHVRLPPLFVCFFHGFSHSRGGGAPLLGTLHRADSPAPGFPQVWVSGPGGLLVGQLLAGPVDGDGGEGGGPAGQQGARDTPKRPEQKAPVSAGRGQGKPRLAEASGPCDGAGCSGLSESIAAFFPPVKTSSVHNLRV